MTIAHSQVDLGSTGTSGLPAVQSGGIPLETYSNAGIKSQMSRPVLGDKFWSTSERSQSDLTREIVEYDFKEPRLINYILLATAHFPHTVTAECWDTTTSKWTPLLEPLGDPASFSVADSVPERVNLMNADPNQHPQHYGAKHWSVKDWRVSPVTTTKVRMVLVRSNGAPPRGLTGVQVPYSLGLKDVQIGYRVNDRSDIPITSTLTDKGFASSLDLLGSRTIYGVREQKASNATTPAQGKAWRCEPQPINYSVVNFYADTRDVSGAGQVIDRFYVDPLTIGPAVNLYYSNDEPETTFLALDEPILYPIAHSYGIGVVPLLAPAQIAFDSKGVSYTDIDNTFLQFDPSRAWWLGLDQIATTGPDGIINAGTVHPWVSFGGNQLRLNGGFIEFITAGGTVCSVPLDTTGHQIGSPFSVVVVFNPIGTNASDFPDGLTVRYRLEAPWVPVQQSVALPLGAMGSRPQIFSLGRGPNFVSPGTPAMSLRAMVLKVDSPPSMADAIRFSEDSSIFAKRSDFVALDSGFTNNALLRMHPSLADAVTNPVGLFGGPGDRYAEMVWTPVNGDYVLKRGYMHLPPTRAKFWNFEFTNLVAEHYESFVPIRRIIKMFPSGVVDAYNRVTSGSSYSVVSGGPGVQTLSNLSEVNRYSDALDIPRDTPTSSSDLQHSATEAQVVYDPVQQTRIAALGSVWGFQPWHIGFGAPQFLTSQKHAYDKVEVQHTTKMAYFVGLKSLVAYRLDYTANDETEQYVEHFYDTANMASSTGVTFYQNQVWSSGVGGEVVSKTFHSTNSVTGVQFATTQSLAVSILSGDDEFTDMFVTDHWAVYGDAQIQRMANHSLRVSRGWFSRTYGALEMAPFGTYAAMGLGKRTYGELEGFLPSGTVGGIASKHVDPSFSLNLSGVGNLVPSVLGAGQMNLGGTGSLRLVGADGSSPAAGNPSLSGAGRIYAAAMISAPSAVTVTMAIVCVAGDRILASVDYRIQPGQTQTFFVGYTVLPTDANERVYVRLVESSRDTFFVKKLSLFTSPLTWEFSNDGGATWWAAMDIRNNPEGVLTFPTEGNQLRWRMRTYLPGASVSALSIRPWYGRIAPGTVI